MPHSSWEDLFAAPENQGRAVQIELRLLRKGGQPFLVLPSPSRAAAATMDLYPAQTPRARAARAALRCLLTASVPFGIQKTSLTLSPSDPFVQFLASFAGQPAPAVPTLGILAGNPNSAGQRFLLLVFNASQRPVAVVKAGLSQHAKALVEQEASFLDAVPPNTAGVPRLRSRFESSRLRALALDFFPGHSPRPRQDAALPALLTSWMHPGRDIPVTSAPEWERLDQAAPAARLLAPLTKRLCGRKVHPAICHGDLAPWNIKVSPTGVWTALDWERGRLAGIPAWDWFHYVIQNSILVAHLSAPALVQRIEKLLGTDVFRHYAAQSGIIGCERELVLAYLLHTIEVIRPSEGLAAARELLRALSARWSIS
ncbi:MAG TPA: phosphotransferase [Candidatus Paceibacterota bacterium]|nr:phosphotransferase [Candidatus Paceibacterota bacterium]